MWSGRRLALLLGLGGLLLVGGFLWRDLHLPQQVGVPSDLPDVRVEQFDLRRQVGGQEWSIRASRAERSDGVAQATSMDLEIQGPGDRVTRVRARKGLFEEAREDMTLWQVEGSLRDEKGKTLSWKAAEARYDGKSREWRFPGGVTFRRGSLCLVAGSGRLLPGGDIHLDRGVKARWVARP